MQPHRRLESLFVRGRGSAHVRRMFTGSFNIRNSLCSKMRGRPKLNTQDLCNWGAPCKLFRTAWTNLSKHSLQSNVAIPPTPRNDTVGADIVVAPLAQCSARPPGPLNHSTPLRVTMRNGRQPCAATDTPRVLVFFRHVCCLDAHSALSLQRR